MSAGELGAMSNRSAALRNAGTIAVFSLLLVSCSGGLSSEETDAVDEYIKESMLRWRIPGLTLAVVKDGEIILQKAYGLADVEAKTPATVETIYPLASASKMFTSVAIMKLVEAGEISVDDPIIRLLPGLPDAWAGITVRQLLTHTSGLPDITVPENQMEYLGKTREETLRKVAGLPLLSKPGERHRYIQTGYMLLGMILERRSGKSFPEVMSEQLFRPLGMTSTRYGDPGRGNAGQAAIYSMVRLEADGKWTRLEQAEPFSISWPDFEYPGAGLNSTVGDLAKWDAALEPGRLLKSSSLQAMWTVTKESLTSYDVGTVGIGYGWYIGELEGHRWVGISGGVSSAFIRFPDEHVTVIILSNCMGSNLLSIAQGVAKRILPNQPRHK